MRGSRGFTLVEALVALALSVVLVGLIATTSVQVQRATDAARLREEAATRARTLFSDVERDLANLIPCPLAAPPLDRDVHDATRPQRALAIERTMADGRAFDVLRLYARTALPGSGIEGACAVIEYSADGSPQPVLVEPPGGGQALGRLRRRVLAHAKFGTGLATVEKDRNRTPPLLENLLSVRIEHASAAGVFANPSPETATGAAFAPGGAVDVGTSDPFEVRATDDGARTLFLALPVGASIALPIRTESGRPVLARFLVRRNQGDVIAVSDRIDEPFPGFHAAEFAPPRLLRMTVEVPFQAGPSPGVARFSSTFVVR